VGFAVAEDQEFVLPPREERPLVTFALFAYNQEKYIREAVEGAFAQTYEPLEIILSDDCSTDRTFEIMKEMVAAYKGAHKVIIRSNSRNLGIAQHVNQIFEIASSELIVVGAGDDISNASRVSALTSEWLKQGKPDGLLHSAYLIIDESGISDGRIKQGRAAKMESITLQKFAQIDFAALIHGATAAYTKSIYSKFGPLKGDYEDVALTLRSVLTGKLIYVDQTLVRYRIGVGNVSRGLRWKDKDHVTRYLLAALRVAHSLKSEYETYCSNTHTPIDIEIKNKIEGIERGYKAALGMGSPNIFRNIMGLVYLPVHGGLRDRLHIARKYFSIIP